MSLLLRDPWKGTNSQSQVIYDVMVSCGLKKDILCGDNDMQVVNLIVYDLRRAGGDM